MSNFKNISLPQELKKERIIPSQNIIWFLEPVILKWTNFSGWKTFSNALLMFWPNSRSKNIDWCQFWKFKWK